MKEFFGDGGDGYFGSQFQNIDRFAAGVVGSRDSEKKGTHFVTRQVENRQSNRIAEPNSDGGGSFTGSQDKSRGNGIAVWKGMDGVAATKTPIAMPIATK